MVRAITTRYRDDLHNKTVEFHIALKLLTAIFFVKKSTAEMFFAIKPILHVPSTFPLGKQ